MEPGKGELNSITCELVGDEVVYELHVPSNVFRAEKLPMYYANETAELGVGETLGSMNRTENLRRRFQPFPRVN